MQYRELRLQFYEIDFIALESSVERGLKDSFAKPLAVSFSKALLDAP